MRLEWITITMSWQQNCFYLYHMRSLIFIFILFFFSISSASINFDTDFQGLSRKEYVSTLEELNFSLKSISQELGLQYGVYFFQSKDNVYRSSAFTRSLDMLEDLAKIQYSIYDLAKKGHYLSLETGTSFNLLKYFDFPFFDYLSSKDQQVFEDILDKQIENNQKNSKRSIALATQIDSLFPLLRTVFLRQAPSSTEQHMTISKENKQLVLAIKSQVDDILLEIKNFKKALQKQQWSSENIFNSYTRKLALSLGVIDASSFKRVFLKYVDMPLNKLYIESSKNPKLSSNLFAFSYYKNSLRRAFNYSEALYYLAPLFLPSTELSIYRNKLWELGQTVEKINSFKYGLNEIVDFLHEHHSQTETASNQCRTLF